MLTPNQGKLIYWIEERERIRLAKESGLPKPWSSDPIFQKTYFTNVNREDDRVTKWIRENWTYPTSLDEDLEIWGTEDLYTVAMIAARLFNLPSTLERIKQPMGGEYEFPYWIEHVDETLTDIQLEGSKVWSGAYIVSTNGKKIPKAEYCVYLLSKLSSNFNPIIDCETLAEAHEKLMKIEGLASFLAAQVIADLKNTVDHPLNSAPDWRTFSAPGPGSLRGLSWFWEEQVTPKNYHKKIEEANELLQFELNDDILNILCMQNLQNCFCEFDKYMRILNKTGRSKRKYNGE